MSVAEAQRGAIVTGGSRSAPRSGYDLRQQGIENTGRVHWNLPVARLVELSVARGEGYLAPGGALVVKTGAFTGRSPKDKLTVAEPSVKDHIWWGPVNRPFDPERFEPLFAKVKSYLQRKELFVFDGWAGADPEHRLGVRVVAEKAWHALFARTLFLRPTPEELESHRPDFTIVN
ncbi:MAG: phosphoenolpyruvate carboxykinase (ATP), partial [Nitrospinota bacterium]